MNLPGRDVCCWCGGTGVYGWNETCQHCNGSGLNGW